MYKCISPLYYHYVYSKNNRNVKKTVTHATLHLNKQCDDVVWYENLFYFSDKKKVWMIGEMDGVSKEPWNRIKCQRQRNKCKWIPQIIIRFGTEVAPIYRHSVHQIVRLAYIKRWALEHSMAEGWISHPSLSLLWFSKSFFLYFRQMKRICFPLWPRWCKSMCSAIDLIQHEKKRYKVE